MSGARHALLWLALIMSSAAVSPWLCDEATLVVRLDSWQRQLHTGFGAQHAAYVAEHSRRQARSLDARWRALYPAPYAIATGVGAPPLSARSVSSPASPSSQSRPLALWLLSMRTATVVAWLPVLMPLWLGALVQGWVLRDIRRHAFAGTDPRVHRACMHASIALGGAGAVALGVPVDLPASMIPVLGATLAVLGVGTVAHLPRWGS
ncbi:MAG: DUF4400 domain-containing protein [Proteobacteria bacterium]|nr:DUF4400 domain-containing protein [Burkholderiales bacterium]